MRWSVLSCVNDECSPPVGTGGHAALAVGAAHHHRRHRGGGPAGLRRQPELIIGQPPRGLQRQLRRRGRPPRARGPVCPPVVQLLSISHTHTNRTHTHTQATYVVHGEKMYALQSKQGGRSD